MNETCTALVPGVVVLTDDTEIKGLLAYHGRTDHLAPRFGMPRTHCVWASGQTMYCVTHFTGYREAADNGYTAMLIDLNQVGNRAAAMLASLFVEAGRDEGGPCFTTEGTTTPEAN